MTWPLRRMAPLVVSLVVAGGALWSARPVSAAPPVEPPTCRGHDATIVRGDGDDVIEGTRGRDVIVAGAGRDKVFGRGGDDVICGNQGMDRLLGNGGDDVLHGGRGADVPYTSGNNPDVYAGLFGNAGRDRLWGGDGIDRLEGGRGDDLLRGGAESDAGLAMVGIASAPSGGGCSGDAHSCATWDGGLFGQAGDDRLLGNRGGDVLDARDGVRNNDRLRGGPDGGAGDLCRSDPDPEVSCES